jgi:hypothetical protein
MHVFFILFINRIEHSTFISPPGREKNPDHCFLWIVYLGHEVDVQVHHRHALLPPLVEVAEEGFRGVHVGEGGVVPEEALVEIPPPDHEAVVYGGALDAVLGEAVAEVLVGALHGIGVDVWIDGVEEVLAVVHPPVVVPQSLEHGAHVPGPAVRVDGGPRPDPAGDDGRQVLLRAVEAEEGDNDGVLMWWC